MTYDGSVPRSPYEVNLGPNVPRGLSSATNNLFSPSELERLLRPYDVDALELPDRLRQLASLGTTDGRLKVTTEGWDLPGPVGPTTSRVTEKLKARLRTGGVPDDATAWQLLPQVLPSELFVGLKMNVNRPFGNGQDDLGVGVVDSPAEGTASQSLTLSGQTVSTFSFDGKSDSTNPNLALRSPVTSLAARQLEARYLYVLVFALADRTKLATAFGTADKAARAVAQWAVNVVDFCDRDNIMTPFDYDPNYADPNDTHPLLSGNGNTATIWNPPANGSCRVWGCERPELLISETLAFHDRRTQDTTDEYDAATSGEADSGKKALYYNNNGLHDTSPGQTYDASFDQSYRPQGSLFVELYNPASPFEPQCGDLYSVSGGTQSLSLTQTSRAAGGVAGAKPSPVWRLLIANDNFGKGVTDPASIPDPDPDDPDPAGTVKPTIEREVYFVDPTKATLPPKTGKIQYYPSTTPTNAVILPGRYALIGPGETKSDPKYQLDQSGVAHPNRTYIGFLVGGTAGNSQTRYIDLDMAGDTSSLPVHNNVNAGGTGSGSGDPGPQTINTPVTLAIDSPNRLSVSESVNAAGSITYDDYETRALNGVVITKDHNGKYMRAGAPAAFDIPFDQRWFQDNPTSLDSNAFNKNQTTPAFRMIYLQRLANPLAPYDVTNNPYRTVDWMAVDLTVFNGVTDQKDPAAGDNSGIAHFEARQRGEYNEGANTLDASGLNQHMNLWAQELPDKTVWGDKDPASHPAANHYFTLGLKHSLGYLNQMFGAPEVNSVTGEKGLPPQNSKYGPFPWLTWNNRPYVNPLELMLVPWVRSSRLLGRFGLAQSGGTTTNPYDTPTSASAPFPPFPHLMNFFASGSGSTPEELHRILEYLGVPSPFVGTDVWANPTSALNGTHSFHPPFNRISNYREPGRINLNTIYDQSVFNALMAGGGTASLATQWSAFLQSRRSGGTGTGGILDMPDVSSPTEFAHPFRSFAGASMIPTLPNDPLKPKCEIDATLLREGASGSGIPLFLVSSTSPSANTNSNPYFHYQGLQRLANLVTTRSNVFAVWITVGYFEVTPAPATLKHDDGSTSAPTTPEYQAVYPGGYQLGAELGLDTGEVVRHRAFYIIDRTLPVGFKRGLDLNTDKAILVNRFIE